MDRAVKNFLWQGNNDFGMHIVGLHTITKPKYNRGQGVCVTRYSYRVLLGKQFWDFTTFTYNLGVRLMKDKYFQKPSFLGAPKSSGSSTWNSMMKARDCHDTSFQFKFGDGESSIWHDSWLTIAPLDPQFPFVDIDLQLKDIYVHGTKKF